MAGAKIAGFDTVGWNISYITTATTAWGYEGSAVYDDDGYIKVDKGSPDKCKWAIFYAVNEKDPLIFVKTEKELKSEVNKLLKRDDVDPKSIRIFSLVGGSKEIK